MQTRAMTTPLAADLVEGWRRAVGLDAVVLAASPRPLARVEQSAAFFGLPLPPEVALAPPAAEGLAAAKPSFRELSEPVLLALRGALHAGERAGQVEAWAETLLRFCEIRFTTLARRSREKIADSDQARTHLLHLAAFLLEYGARHRDARFLNTVLKLLEAPWFARRSTLVRDLGRSGEVRLAALLHLRLLVASEHEVHLLEAGVQP